MKISELRILNLIILDGDLVAVKELKNSFGEYYINVISVMRNYLSCNPISSYKPIPLTNLWMPKFGLSNSDRQNNCWRLPNGWGVIILAQNGWYYSANGHSISATFQYVHEFQNLFHGLTGKDLDFKP